MEEGAVAGNCRLLRRLVKELGQDVTKAPRRRNSLSGWLAGGGHGWVFLTPCPRLKGPRLAFGEWPK